METWKILLITLLSAVVLGCIIGVVSGRQQVKKLKGMSRALLTSKERMVYGALVLFGAACIAVGIFVVPNLGAADAGMMDEGMRPGGMFDDSMGIEANPGDIMINSVVPEDAIEGELVEGDLVEGEVAEGETIEGEVVEDETVEGEVAEDETVGDEAVVTEDADAAVAAPAPAPRRAPAARASGGMVIYRAG
jgi:hypothetical protein